MNKQNRNGMKNSLPVGPSLPCGPCPGSPVPTPVLKKQPHPFKATADKAR